jgi:XTP/dITP diphosphohydrolase
MIPEGSHGFGYDPIFVPDGASESFATMGLLEKNKFSHRRKALDQLITFLKKQHYGQG